MRVGAIVQARLTSTRLPGKVLKELPCGSGVTVLEQVIRRLKKSEKLKNIIVATTTDKRDDELVTMARKKGIKYFRGSTRDVLSRYYFCAKENNIDIIVRITSDCPCIDARIVNLIVREHMKRGADYTSNILKRTFPRGLDTEVFNFDVLEEMYKNANKDYQREHVTPYIYENPARFKIIRVKAPRELFAPNIRITLDTEEDYALLSIIFGVLYKKNRYFDAYDIVNLFRKKLWLKLINGRIIQKKIK